MSNLSPPRAPQWPRVVLVLIALLVLAALGVVLWQLGKRAQLVAALEREVGVENRYALSSSEHGFRERLSDWLEHRFRIKGVLGGPVDLAVITIDGALHGDPASALAAFPHLRTIYFREAYVGP